MDRLSPIEENKMLHMIDDVMDRCGKGEDPSRAVASLALQNNMNTQEASRVCETVNKLASISYLSSHPENRGASFPLADSEAVRQIMKDSMKAASDPFTFRKTASEGLPRMSKEEMLSAIRCVTPEQRLAYKQASAVADYSAAWEDLQRASQALKLASDECRQQRVKLEMLLGDMAGKVASMGEQGRADTAAYALAAYGPLGEDFITALENVSGVKCDRSQKVFVKTGSDIESRIDNFMELTDKYLSIKYATDFLFSKTAASGKGGKGGKGGNGGNGGGNNSPFDRNVPKTTYNIPVEQVDAAWRAMGYGNRNPNLTNDNAFRDTDAYRDLYRNMNDAYNFSIRLSTRGDVSDQELADAARRNEEEKIVHEDFENWGRSQGEGALMAMWGGQNPYAHRLIRTEQEHEADRAFMEKERERRASNERDDRILNKAQGVSDFITGTVSDTVDNTKAILTKAVEAMQQADNLRKSLHSPDRSGNEYSDPLSLKASKYLDNLDLYDVFAKSYLSDPYLRQYSPQEVAEAFNIVHEVAPDLINSKSNPHVISSMIRKYLANNNQIDPLEIRDLVGTELNRKQIEKTEQEIRNLRKGRPATSAAR